MTINLWCRNKKTNKNPLKKAFQRKQLGNHWPFYGVKTRQVRPDTGTALADLVQACTLKLAGEYTGDIHTTG